MRVVDPGERWELEVEPFAARFEAPVALRLHDGPGAAALAVAIAARADLLEESWRVSVAGPCALPNLRLPFSERGPTSRMQDADGPGIEEAMAQADLLGAYIAWERQGRPVEHLWLEPVLWLCAGDIDGGEQAAWALPDEVSTSWRAFTVMLALLARDRYAEARVVLDHLCESAGDPLAVALAEVFRSMVRGRPTADPRFQAWNTLMRNTPGARLERVGKVGAFAAVASEPLRSSARPRSAAARGLVRAYTDPSAPIPPPTHLGGFARAGLLLAGARALENRDRRTLRSTAATLERLRIPGAPEAAMQAALAARGDPWDELVWLRALAPMVSEQGRSDVTERIARLAGEVDVLDDYLLHEQVGAGAMGSVYRATHMPTNETVAIKRMHDATSTRVAERFAAEIELVARMEHPAIAGIVDHGAVVSPEGRTPYLVMEYVDGGALGQADGSWQWNQVRAIAVALADAVAYAHSRGVLHRDIKPANVMMATDGTIRLVDFGLGVLPRKGVVAGTPPFMAPEQLRGHTDARTDVYGLGALVWSLCTGAPPWLASFETLLKLDRSVLPPFEPLFPVPRGLLDVLTYAMQADPRRRIRSAAALAEALSALDELAPDASDPSGRDVPIGRTPTAPLGAGTTEWMQTLSMEALLDLAPAELPEDTAGLPSLPADPRTEATAEVFADMDRLHFRPRLPTLSMVRAGDPPVLFRRAAQRELWLAFMSTLAGRTRHVLLRGPRSSGRHTLVRWLVDTARRAGFPVSTRPDEPGHPITVDPPGEARGLVVWIESTPVQTDHTLTLPRFQPFEVFTILCSRLRLSYELAREAALRSVGCVDLALDILEDWLENVGLAPTVQGLRLLGDIPASGPREDAWWAERLRHVSPEVLAALRQLARRASGFGPADVQALPSLGLPTVDPFAWALRRDHAFIFPQSLLAQLPDVERDPHDWERLKTMPYFRYVDAHVARIWYGQALEDRGARALHGFRLGLMIDSDPRWRRQDAMESGRLDEAAYAMHSESFHRGPPEEFVEETLFRSLEPGTESWRAAGLAWVHRHVLRGEPEELDRAFAASAPDPLFHASAASLVATVQEPAEAAPFLRPHLLRGLSDAVFVSLAMVHVQHLHLLGRVEDAQPLVDRLARDPLMSTGQAVTAGHAVLIGAPFEVVAAHVESAAMHEGWQVWRQVALLLVLGVRIDAPRAYWEQWASMAQPLHDDWVHLVMTALLARVPGADPERRRRVLALVGEG